MTSDICIIGGGLVGLTAALALSAQHRRVLLVEGKSAADFEPDRMDVRSIALSLSSVNIFRALDILPDLQAAFSPISHIHVSSSGHFGVTRLHAAEIGLGALGQVVEYHALMQTLLNRVNQDPGIELLSPARFVALSQQADGVAITLEHESTHKTVHAQLLLVADGANSMAREALDIPSTVHDYSQSAVIANVEVDAPQEGWAYERFTSRGPLAMLPLSESRYALVWTREPQQAAQLMQMSEQEFFQHLSRDFGYRLGVFKTLGRRDQFDLKLLRSESLVSGRAVLVGNAANSLHPVAGQGFNLALRDIAGLYDALKDVELASLQVAEVMQSYQQKRLQDQQQTIRLGHGLVELFSNDLPFLNHIRAGALACLDLCPSLKQSFAWSAMGYGSQASSLMRGEK